MRQQRHRTQALDVTCRGIFTREHVPGQPVLRGRVVEARLSSGAAALEPPRRVRHPLRSRLRSWSRPSIVDRSACTGPSRAQSQGPRGRVSDLSGGVALLGYQPGGGGWGGMGFRACTEPSRPRFSSWLQAAAGAQPCTATATAMKTATAAATSTATATATRTAGTSGKKALGLAPCRSVC